MFKEIKKLLASKISVNITIVEPAQSGVISSTVPVIERSPIKVNRIRKSNFRFVEKSETEHSGKTKIYYMTEEFKNGDWRYVSETLEYDKDKAMQLHLKLLEQGNLEPTSTKTIMWEGLDKEETRSWIELQSAHKENTDAIS